MGLLTILKKLKMKEKVWPGVEIHFLFLFVFVRYIYIYIHNIYIYRAVPLWGQPRDSHHMFFLLIFVCRKWGFSCWVWIMLGKRQFWNVSTVRTLIPLNRLWVLHTSKYSTLKAKKLMFGMLVAKRQFALTGETTSNRLGNQPYFLNNDMAVWFCAMHYFTILYSIVI